MRASRTRTAVFISLGAALLVGFFVVGRLSYMAVIGLHQSAYLGGEWMHRLMFEPQMRGSAVAVIASKLWMLAIPALAFLAVFWARRSDGKAAQAVDPSRRWFLASALTGGAAAAGAAVVAAGAAAARTALGWGTGGPGWSPVRKGIFKAEVARTHPSWDDAWRGSRIRAHRRLGRTGWAVSDVVLGAGLIRGEDGEEIVRKALERGVNYFDTSPDYSAAGSEPAVGAAVKGHRDQVFLATKFCTANGHLPPGTPVRAYKDAIEASLRTLGTDHVDLVHIHACDEVERLMDPNVHEAFDRLKEEGKVRFLGFSTHTPRLVEVANAAISSGRFDVMMLAYHHGIWPVLGEIIGRARSEQDMGVVAMKTLKGAKHHGLAGFQDEAGVYSQAALKWTLSNPDVSCAVISFSNLQHVDEYLAASGQAPSAAEIAALGKYDRLTAGTHCAPHCGACLEHCPEGLPIHDVLRHRMYFEDYGNEKEGMRLYARLEKNASACVGCSAPCANSCPLGIPIQERMLGAHDLLTLS